MKHTDSGVMFRFYCVNYSNVNRSTSICWAPVGSVSMTPLGVFIFYFL